MPLPPELLLLLFEYFVLRRVGFTAPFPPFTLLLLPFTPPPPTLPPPPPQQCDDAGHTADCLSSTVGRWCWCLWLLGWASVTLWGFGAQQLRWCGVAWVKAGAMPTAVGAWPEPRARRPRRESQSTLLLLLLLLRSTLTHCESPDSCCSCCCTRRCSCSWLLLLLRTGREPPPATLTHISWRGRRVHCRSCFRRCRSSWRARVAALYVDLVVWPSESRHYNHTNRVNSFLFLPSWLNHFAVGPKTSKNINKTFS